MKNEINWEEVRIQAAIAMAPKCYEATCSVLKMGASISPYKSIPESTAVNAVKIADRLVEELRTVSNKDTYKDGYRDALSTVRDVIRSNGNNLARMNAIYKLLDCVKDGGE